MNAFVKNMINLAGCLTLLLVFQTVAYAGYMKNLTISIDGNSDGELVVEAWYSTNYIKETISSSRTFSVGKDATVKLTAIPGIASQFSNWAGYISGTNNPKTFTMDDAARSVTAKFTTVVSSVPLINLTINGTGSGFVKLQGTSHNYTATASASSSCREPLTIIRPPQAARMNSTKMK